MNQPKIGFIGFGEAAFNIARGFKKEGINNISAYDKYADREPYSKLIKTRAVETDVALKNNMKQLVDNTNIIFSAISANMVIPIAEEVQSFLKPNQIYVDINASSPISKKHASKIIADSGACFVDAAVMASIPLFGHKVPLLLSGPGARQFIDVMKKYNMDLSYYGDEVGIASAIKMFRSIFMKGIAMLLLETIVASHKYGVEEDVWSTILETLTNSSDKRINGWITRTVINSERREHEMEEVVSLLQELEIDSTMSLATKEKMRWCTNLGLREYFKGVPPDDYREALRAIDRKLLSKKEVIRGEHK